MEKELKKINDELKKYLAFDQYGRYSIIRDAIDINKKENEKVSVLDVGGRGNIMTKFLPEDNVFYLDPLVDSKDDNYIEGDGCNIPLEDNSFDWVVSADVFEHIPEKDRRKFISENIRVAKRGVILAAPFYSKKVRKAEIEANENFKKFSGGDDNMWLKEHIENGLPREIELEEYLHNNNFSFQKIHNNSLEIWKHLIGVVFNISEPVFKKMQKDFMEFNYFYNTEIHPYDNDPNSYRKIYFIKKTNNLNELKMNDLLDEERKKSLWIRMIDFLNLISFNYVKSLRRNIEKVDKANETIIRNKKRIYQLKESNRKKDDELFEIRNSLRWKIPNFVYKIYRKNIKKWIPRSFFKALSPLFVYLNSRKDLNKGKYKFDEKIIKKVKFNKIVEINIPKFEKPEVSIIIPVYNKWNYTYKCIESLVENTDGVSYEVIVVDDNSNDQTPEMVKKVSNITYIKNEKNLGFIGSCNAGAEKANGKYVVFLNNDTYVLKNWLKALVETFENNSDAGLVGSKLIYPDGRLQEAGGIVWKNENAWNYGRFKDPESYEFNYLKDIDYISGASIMIPAEIFRKLNGFDELYLPAYFEDTDIAFRIRQMGLRTLYQPKSEIIHFEGVSAGKDLKKGMKQYQVANADKFFGRWKDVLEKENLSDEEGPFLARDKSKDKKVILYVDWNVPTYDKDAGSFVTFEYLKMLQEAGFKVIFWPFNLAKLQPYTDRLQQMGVEVVYGNESFEKFISENGRWIDYTFLSRPEVASEYIDIVKEKTDSKIIYVAHDLHYLRLEREAQANDDEEKKMKAEEFKNTEGEIFKKSDISLFFSDKEVELVKEEFPDVEVDIMPWIEKLNSGNDQTEFGEREGVLFIGGFLHPPNVDSIIWFHNKVFPILKKKIPGFKVTIMGSNAPQEIKNLDSEDFNVLGFVKEEDVPSFFNESKIFIAPLRFGAGFKGKIAKAMSFGLPVVTTEIGAEGIGLIDGESAMIADSPEEFAEDIIELYSDEVLWGKLFTNSQNYIKNNFSVDGAKNKCIEIIKNLDV